MGLPNDVTELIEMWLEQFFDASENGVESYIKQILTVWNCSGLHITVVIYPYSLVLHYVIDQIGLT